MIRRQKAIKARTSPPLLSSTTIDDTTSDRLLHARKKKRVLAPLLLGFYLACLFGYILRRIISSSAPQEKKKRNMSDSESDHSNEAIVVGKTIMKAPNAVNKSPANGDAEKKRCSACRSYKLLKEFVGATPRHEGQELRTCTDCRMRNRKVPLNESMSLAKTMFENNKVGDSESRYFEFTVFGVEIHTCTCIHVLLCGCMRLRPPDTRVPDHHCCIPGCTRCPCPPTAVRQATLTHDCSLAARGEPRAEKHYQP